MEPFPALRFHMTKAGPFRAARCPPAPLSVPVSGPLPVAEVSQDEGRAAGMMPRWTSLLTAPWIPLLPWCPAGRQRLSSQSRSRQALSIR